MINGDNAPLSGGATAEPEGLRHGNNAAQLLGGDVNNGATLLHRDGRYSTAIHPVSSGAIPGIPQLRRQFVMSLGEKMQAARKEAEKTQQQVADEIGVTKGAVSQWETDVTVPELVYFKKFCLSVHASADEVLLEAKPDPLLRQLISIYEKLSPDGRDEILGKANRILSEEQPGPSVHDPFGRLPPGATPRKHAKRASKAR